MRETLVPVPPGDKEHSCTVCNGTNDGAGGDTSSRAINRAAGTNITSKCASVARTPTSRSSWVGGLVRIGAVARNVAVWKWAGSVDEACQIVDSLILVVPEGISRVAELGSELRLQIFGNGKQSQCGNEALVHHGIKWLETDVSNLGRRDVQTVRNSLGEVVEDLFANVILRHKRVIEWPLEADLTEESVLGNI